MTHDELCKALLVERFAHPTPEYHNPRPEQTVAWRLVHEFHSVCTDECTDGGDVRRQIGTPACDLPRNTEGAA